MKHTWQSVRLDEVVEIASGQVDPRETPYCDLPHIGGDNIESYTGRLMDLRTAKELRLISGKYAFDERDVLYSKIRPALNKVVAPNFKGICSADIYPIRPRNGRLCREYLVYVLRSNDFLGYSAKHSSRTNIPKINREALLAYVTLIPPVSEQRRIATILVKADAIRRKREEGIRLTEELLRSTFLEMFGDPATNPKKWPMRVMGAVVTGTQYGTAEKSNSDGAGIPVLRMNNITYGGEFDLTDLKWSEIEDAYLEQLTVKRGDLLFNRTNSPELVGKTAVWDRDESYAYAGYLFRVRFDEKVVLPDYVSAFLNSAYGKKMLFAKAKPSNNMSNFSAGEFCRIELPVPDIKVQRRFADVVTAVRGMKEKRAAALAQASDLFGSLVQRAFQGEL
jgi:type I restriction enzyme, S subunit